MHHANHCIITLISKALLFLLQWWFCCYNALEEWEGGSNGLIHSLLYAQLLFFGSSSSAASFLFAVISNCDVRFCNYCIIWGERQKGSLREDGEGDEVGGFIIVCLLLLWVPNFRLFRMFDTLSVFLLSAMYIIWIMGVFAKNRSCENFKQDMGCSPQSKLNLV